MYESEYDFLFTADKETIMATISEIKNKLTNLQAAIAAIPDNVVPPATQADLDAIAAQIDAAAVAATQKAQPVQPIGGA